jgi:hypothetical protein
MSNNKQTAVDWLVEQLECFGNKHELQMSWATLDELLEQAKEMEKQQMIDFGFDTYCFISDIMKVPFEQLSENRLNAEQYYNETYGK